MDSLPEIIKALMDATPAVHEIVKEQMQYDRDAQERRLDIEEMQMRTYTFSVYFHAATVMAVVAVASLAFRSKDVALSTSAGIVLGTALTGALNGIRAVITKNDKKEAPKTDD